MLFFLLKVSQCHIDLSFPFLEIRFGKHYHYKCFFIHGIIPFLRFHRCKVTE